MSTASENMRRVIQYLDSQNWKYNVDYGRSIIDFEMNIRSQLKHCHIVIDINDREILTYGRSSLDASESKRSAAAEFITRANYGLKVGCFEMDMDDGEIRYKTCLSTASSTPSLEEVERHVDMPFLMLQRYGDGLLKVLLGFASPKSAIQEIEG